MEPRATHARFQGSSPWSQPTSAPEAPGRAGAESRWGVRRWWRAKRMPPSRTHLRRVDEIAAQRHERIKLGVRLLCDRAGVSGRDGAQCNDLCAHVVQAADSPEGCIAHPLCFAPPTSWFPSTHWTPAGWSCPACRIAWLQTRRCSRCCPPSCSLPEAAQPTRGTLDGHNQRDKDCVPPPTPRSLRGKKKYVQEALSLAFSVSPVPPARLLRVLG